MERDTKQLSEEFQIAGQIFDRYAEAKRTGEVAADIGNRAVAAAQIISFVMHDQKWFEILDEALQERGVDSRYSELTPYKLRARSRAASDQTTELTRRCRTILQELEALNTFDQSNN